MRIALGIEYNGHSFYGFQSQKNLPTIQSSLESALSKIANEKIQIHCAGRTDAGVHAIEQVVHFDTAANRIDRAWTAGTNTLLPETIAVKWAKPVDENFHARFSALSRRYRYLIYNHTLRSALYAHRAAWYHQSFHIEYMQQAAKYLIGEHDFTSFRSAECESKTPMRYVSEIIITRNEEFIIIEIEANAFLHHMVRNIVGVLLRIGSGVEKPEWMHEVLLAKDRKKAAETAQAQGLYLMRVTFP